MRGTFLRVGTLLLLTVAALLGAVLLLAGDPFRHGTAYETYFDESVQGLGDGAAVRYRGVALGRVTTIALAGAAYGRAATAGAPGGTAADATSRLVVVRFELDDARAAGLPDPARAVAQGLRVRLATPGLTGPEYLELDFADPARFPPEQVPWTPRDPYVPSVPSTISVVRNGAEHLLRQLDRVDVAGLANGLGALVAILRDELGPQGGLRGTLSQAGGTLAQAGDTLRLANEQLRAADLPGLAAGLRRTAADADALLRGRELHGLLASASGAADRLSAVAARLPPLLTTLQGVAGRADEGTATLESQLGPMLRDARAALRNLREASEAARQDPAGLLLAAPPPRVLPR